MKPVLQFLCLALFAGAWHGAHAQPSCPNFDFSRTHGAFGPEDYRKTPQNDRDLVEKNHFTASVESLTRGQSGTVPGDISYTLSVFPNHPRALLAADQLGQRENNPKPAGLRFSVQCYYERAITFQRNDHPVRMLYAMFLIRNKQGDLARKHIEYVEKEAPDDVFTQYNVALLYLELGDLAKSREIANQLYKEHELNPQLKERLAAKGFAIEGAKQEAAAEAQDAASAPK